MEWSGRLGGWDSVNGEWTNTEKLKLNREQIVWMPVATYVDNRARPIRRWGSRCCCRTAAVCRCKFQSRTATRSCRKLFHVEIQHRIIVYIIKYKYQYQSSANKMIRNYLNWNFFENGE